MAYIHDIAVTTQASTTAATYVMNMPQHAVGDLLVWYASADAGTLTVSGSAWTIIGTNPTSSTTNIIVTAAGWRVATTTAETLSLGTSDVASCIVVCFKEVGATPFNVNPVLEAVNTATTTPVGASQSSTAVNTLHVSMIAQAGANPMAVSGPGAMYAAISDAGGTTDTLSAHNAVAWKFKRAIGAIPPINWVSNLNTQYTRLTFTLNPSVGARIPPYIDGDVLTPATLVHLGSYSGGTQINGTTTTTNGITATIAGKTATPATATLLVDSGVDPYTSVLTSAAAQTATNVLVGPEITITTAMNFTNKLLVGAVNSGNWKQGAFGVGSVLQGGVVVRVGSGVAGTTTWNAYQVAAKDSQQPPVVPTVFVIQPGYSTTAYATGAGGSASVTAVKFVQVLRNAPSFSSQVGLSELWMVDIQVVAGGDATYPVDLNALVSVGKSFRLPLIQKAGASGVIFFAPIQVGGGDAVYFDVSGGVIQFPGRASAVTKDLQYHGDNNRLGFYVSAKSGDTFKLTDSLIKSPIPQIFEITSTATSAATWDLSGTTFDNMTVTLRPVTAFSNLTFTACPSLNLSGCTISDSSIQLSSTASDSLTVTNTTSISNSNINTTKLSSGVGLVSLNSTTGIPFSNCTFTGSSTTGHALIITQAGSYTFNSLTFNGYGNTGTTSAAIHNTSNGVVTITVIGGSTPTFRNSGTSSTNIQTSYGITLTGLKANSEVRIYLGTDPATATEVAGIENSGTSFAFSHSAAGQQGYIRVINFDYQTFDLNITFTTEAAREIQITQIIDRVAANP